MIQTPIQLCIHTSMRKNATNQKTNQSLWTLMCSNSDDDSRLLFMFIHTAMSACNNRYTTMSACNNLWLASVNNRWLAHYQAKMTEPPNVLGRKLKRGQKMTNETKFVVGTSTHRINESTCFCSSWAVSTGKASGSSWAAADAVCEPSSTACSTHFAYGCW